MHNRNSGEELANRSQPEVPPTTTTTSITTRVEPDVCVTVRDDPIPLCATSNRLQTSNLLLLQQCRTCTANNKDRQRNNSCCYYNQRQQHQPPLNDHGEQVAVVNAFLHPRDHPEDGQTKTTTTSSPPLLKNCNDLKRAAVDKLQVHYSACHLDNCVSGCRENHPNGVIPTKYQVLGGHEPHDSIVAAAVCRHHRCQQQQQPTESTTVGEGFQCKFNMMNGNLHLKSSDALAVAMETFDSNAPCATSPVVQQQHQQPSLVGQQQQQQLLPNLVHHHVILNGLTDKNSLNEQQQMLEQLNGMSINERRFVTGFGNGGKNGGSGSSMLLTPRITLTSADDMDDGHHHHCDDMMMDYELNDSGPLSPNFLAVPKLQEVGKERRPPVMVKSV